MKLKRAITIGLLLALFAGIMAGSALMQDGEAPTEEDDIEATADTAALDVDDADNTDDTDTDDVNGEEEAAPAGPAETSPSPESPPEGVGIVIPGREVERTTTTITESATSTPIPEAPPAPADAQTYTVVRGDTLFRIAQRFGTTTSALAALNGITNPSLIYAGQVLRIPAEGAAPLPTLVPTSTATTPPPPAEQETYVVQRGDTLYRIAVRNNSTVAAFTEANNIANPNVIFVGQRLVIPGAGSPPAAPAPTATPTDPDTPTEEPAAEQPSIDAPGFAYGVEAFFFGQNVDALITQIDALGVAWVKVRVDWRAIEPQQGQINLDELTTIVNALDAAGLNILLTLTNAPAWARSSTDENGPPDDLANFTNFVSMVANAYAEVVDAYEIWDEPNLRRNWNCNRQMCDTDYVEMLRLAATAIKAADPSAQVISAGLAPTGFNDRVNAIDDRVFLRAIFERGGAAIIDGVGAHPGGWANPPDATCCEQPAGVESHYEDERFYFLENLRQYREIMVQAGVANTPIWITKFGWGSSEGGTPPGELNQFVRYTSLAEQAIYVPRAFEIGAELGYIGPMILDNLNACQGFSLRPEACYNSLIAPNGTPRLVFEAVANIDKSAQDISPAAEGISEAVEIETDLETEADPDPEAPDETTG